MGRIPRFLRPYPQIEAPFVRRVSLSDAEAVVADTDGVLEAVTDDGTEQTITEGFTDPPYTRNITATAGGTATDIGTVQVEVTGTDINGNVITETLPAFTENTAGSVEGSKAFRTVTEVVIPAHDGTSATTAIGFGDKIGLSDKLTVDTVWMAAHDGDRETTLPTVTVSGDNVEDNTAELDTTLDGSAVDIWYVAESS